MWRRHSECVQAGRRPGSRVWPAATGQWAAVARRHTRACAPGSCAVGGGDRRLRFGGCADGSFHLAPAYGRSQPWRPAGDSRMNGGMWGRVRRCADAAVRRHRRGARRCEARRGEAGGAEVMECAWFRSPIAWSWGDALAGCAAGGVALPAYDECQSSLESVLPACALCHL